MILQSILGLPPTTAIIGGLSLIIGFIATGALAIRDIRRIVKKDREMEDKA